MANLFDKKLQLLEKLTAIKALNEIKLPKNVSFPSLNGKNNALDFLLDLVKITVGYEKLKDSFIDFLTNKIPSLEFKIRFDILNVIKSFFYCNLDPTIPNSFIEGLGFGFSVQVKNIDFFKILKISPISIDGKLIYSNNPNDLDVFLYNTLQSNLGIWNNIFVVKFSPIGIVNGKSVPNVLQVTLHDSWQGRKIDELSIELFNKLKLFEIDDLLVKIIDVVFGAVSSLRVKGDENAEQIAKIELTIDKLVNSSVEAIDDNFFIFSAEENNLIKNRAQQIRRGVLQLNTCDSFVTDLGFEQVLDIVNSLRGVTSVSDKRNVLANGIESMLGDTLKNLNETDKYGTSLQIYAKMFKNIIIALISSVISPKINLVINFYYNLFSQLIEYTNFEEFVKSIKNILVGLIKNSILPIITDFLYDLVVNEIVELAKLNLEKLISEASKTKIGVLLSLVGVPDEIRRQIESLL